AVCASGQGLGLAVAEVIHHDEITASAVIAPELDITAGNPDEEDLFVAIEDDPQEREGLVALGRQHEAAEQERAVDVEVLDLRAVVPVHVADNAAEPPPVHL